MVTLKQTVRNSTSWAKDRIHTICKSDDPLDYLNAYSVAQEFLDFIKDNTLVIHNKNKIVNVSTN